MTTSIKIAAPTIGELDVIHAILTETYWSPGIPRDVVDRAFANSVVALMAQPSLTDLRRWMLGTRDAHTVCAPLGFTPLGAPERVMLRLKENPYGLPTG